MAQGFSKKKNRRPWAAILSPEKYPAVDNSVLPTFYFLSIMEI